MDLSALNPLRRTLIAEANSLINWLLDAVEDALAPGVRRTLPGLKSLYRDYLLPAEAALRRALHILAADLPAPAKKAPKTRSPAHPREGGDLNRKSPNRVPVFRLSEPQPRPQTDHLPKRLRPRISIIGVTPRPAAPAPRRKLNEADLEAQLHRRLDALTAALNNPLANVRRLQRRLAKAGAARPKLAAAIPGHAAPPLAGDGHAFLTRLNDAARAADTS